MKKYLQKNVWDAASERFDYIFTHFSRVCVSFSNGKDSGVLLNLAIEAARRHNRLPVNALYIDFEAQYKHAIDFTHRMFSRDEVTGWWVCLPIHLRNAVSQITPYWVCWDKDKRDAWVREYPDNPHVITDAGYFPFFRPGMEFEEFVPAFGEWFGRGEKTAICIGIRSDESLNRFRTIASGSKVTLDGLQWTTKLHPRDEGSQVYNCYPIYDWRVEDVWTANGRNGWDYNKIYDLMHMAGVPITKQRLCQPYGDDQRQGLHLFKALEPETWGKVVARVAGANFGNRYTETGRAALGNGKVNLPPGYTCEAYAEFLLGTMLPQEAEYYRGKIKAFLQCCEDEGIATGAKSEVWRRITRTLLKNDRGCRGLSVSQLKRDTGRREELTAMLQEQL